MPANCHSVSWDQIGFCLQGENINRCASSHNVAIGPDNKARIYKEYHSVRPLVRIGTLPPLSRQRVRVWGSPNSGDWKKSQHSAYSVVLIQTLATTMNHFRGTFRDLIRLKVYCWRCRDYYENLFVLELGQCKQATYEKKWKRPGYCTLHCASRVFQRGKKQNIIYLTSGG